MIRALARGQNSRSVLIQSSGFSVPSYYACKIKRAQILLDADSGLSDDDTVAAVAVSGSTAYRTKRRFVEGNLEAALDEEPRAGADRKLTSNEEALLVATACSSPPLKVAPAGRWSCWLARWSS